MDVAMTARPTWLRVFAMLLGLALLAGLSATPARAIEPYPGETQEAFAARARLDQQAKLAAADAASGSPYQTHGGGGGGSLGGALKLGIVSLAMLAIGGLRMSRGIFRASRTIAKASGASTAGETFEDRLAERLRELERTDALPTAPLPATQPVASAPPRPMVAGPRTFGKRVA